jgi:diguanylate cyclase (GGDEF)-like protein/PAS domain S-box-containing protein
MIDLKELFITHERQLADSLQGLAENHGFASHAQAKGKSWQSSMAVMTNALINSFETQGINGCHASPSVVCEDDQLTEFALQTSRRHRKNGINLASFLAVLKFYRQAYLDLLHQVDNADTRQERGFINRFFDRMEISQSMDWVRHAEEKTILQAKANNHDMANEKNRFLTLFDSLISSVFLLDTDLNIEIMNRAATEIIGPNDLPEELQYTRPSRDTTHQTIPTPKVSLKKTVPWLYAGISGCRNDKGLFNESRFDTTEVIDGRRSYFTIAVAPMADTWGQFKGTTIVVDDVTERVEMELQLARERNRAAEYLNVVGAIVLAVDASGSILLLNQTGCDILGYESHEIIGKNWVDIAIPETEREELRDYFYSILSDDIKQADRRNNHIITHSGKNVMVEWNNQILRNEGGIPIGILASGMDITERHLMEEALAEKELWLRNTFVALTEAVLILTPGRKIMDATPAAETMFQRSYDELTKMPIEALHINSEASAKYRQIMDDAFEQGATAEFEFTLCRKDGSTFPTENSVSLIVNDDNKPLGVVNVIRDISRRKKAERVLRESEEKFRRIFEVMSDGFMVTSLSGIIQMVNPATNRLLGFSEGELEGEDISTLYTNREERRNLRHQLINKGTVSGIHLTATKKDGKTILVEANANIVMGDHGHPIAMEGTFRDITARIKAEKILREREKLYRAFFENNHAVMLLEDPRNGDIVDANPAASEFYGYSVEKMRTMRMDQINALGEEDIFQEMFRARNENRAYFIFKHILASGEIRDVELYSGPILVHGKQLLYSVIHDVTARIKLERDMTRMATTDALTGANNRHQFFLLAKQEFKSAMRYKLPLAVIMLDIDYFKSINDEYGHQIGDEVLKALSSSAIDTLREADIFGRLGGEEFAVVLPKTDRANAKDTANRLRKSLENLEVQAKNETVTFTVSVGVTTAWKKDKSLEEVLNRADEALYKAKRGGRNKTVVT